MLAHIFINVILTEKTQRIIDFFQSITMQQILKYKLENYGQSQQAAGN